jgi:hypothetical protein
MQQIDSLRDLLQNSQSIAVVFGQQPTYDAMAAGLGLYVSLEQAGKQVQAVSQQPPIVHFSNLVGIDRVTTSLQATASNQGNEGLIISLPYKQGAIEKISYDIIGDKINLTVVPGPDGLNFTPDQIMFQAPSQKLDLFITIGVPSEQEIASVLQASPNAYLVNIDIAQNNTQYGTVALIDPNNSSLSELVTKLLFELRLPIDVDTAQNLLMGIVDRTENFQSEYTTAAAFELAGQLIQLGARRMPVQARPMEQPPYQPMGNFPPQPMPMQQPAYQPRPQPAQPRPNLSVDQLRQNLQEEIRQPQMQRPQAPAYPMPGFQNPLPGNYQAPTSPLQPLEATNDDVETFITPEAMSTHTTAESTPYEIANNKLNDEGKKKIPKDWFEPRIYKGSSNVS